MRANIDEILNKHQGFFAFSKEQLERQQKKDVKYMLMGGGLVLPEKNATQFIEDVDESIKKSVEQDLSNNSKEAIIWRELANYESQISMQIDDVVDALAHHGITYDDIQAEYGAYMKHCKKHNYF